MKKPFILLAVFLISICSSSRTIFIDSEENDINTSIGQDENNGANVINSPVYDETLKGNQQNGRNSKNKKRGNSSRKKTKEKSSNRGSNRNATRNSQRNKEQRRTPQNTKRSSSSDMGIGLMADIMGGYSNFRWSDGSPVAGLGLGGGVTGQFHLNEIDDTPDGYIAELGVGFLQKGSGAYPIYYANAKVMPLGYTFNHLFGDFSLFVKAGGYVAYPLSKIETNTQSFDTNFDYGAIGSVGVSYERVAIAASYEHGFSDVCNANISLKNQNIFLTISYRIF